ncbi:hypothetical protein E2C01_037438 [Portunus trituberculatus]|uniref:Uncharacterized protein n=1 Tax=Portunus trituberculatus TaxID=210409 RepID=A0A5B7FEL9_PORTR|nr:hypothetical protein [Portunus trituberculatus]
MDSSFSPYRGEGQLKTSWPHMMRMFVHDRAETPLSQSIPAWTPNHPSQDDPYWAIPPAGVASLVQWQPT